jgi:hypothetical protein
VPSQPNRPRASLLALSPRGPAPLQNRELFMSGSGDGALYLYKYHYPDQRKVKVSAEEQPPHC